MIIEVNKDDLPVDGMEDVETVLRELEDDFDIGAPTLAAAFVMVNEFLTEEAGEGMFDITSIMKRDDVSIINWPGGDKCQCPTCRTERAEEEDKICFKCSCGYEIKIIDDFGEIACPKCNKIISRDRIIGHGDNYLFLNIGE